MTTLRLESIYPCRVSTASASAGGTVNRFEKYPSIGTTSEVDLVILCCCTTFCMRSSLEPQWLWGTHILAPHLASLGVWLHAFPSFKAMGPTTRISSHFHFPQSPISQSFALGRAGDLSTGHHFLESQSRIPWSYAMTVGLLHSRALALRLLSRCPSTPVLLSSLRVRHDQNAGHQTSPSHSNVEITYSRLGQKQNYATGVPASRPGRPKAHTGRATASKKKSAARSTSAAKNSTVTKKAAKPKRKTKTKAKPKTKRKTGVLTKQQKANKEKKAAALKQRNLRITALLTPPAATPPKQLPRTAYMVVNAENQVKGTSPTDNARASAAKYKALTPEEREVGLII